MKIKRIMIAVILLVMIVGLLSGCSDATYKVTIIKETTELDKSKDTETKEKSYFVRGGEILEFELYTVKIEEVSNSKVVVSSAKITDGEKVEIKKGKTVELGNVSSSKDRDIIIKMKFNGLG